MNDVFNTLSATFTEIQVKRHRFLTLKQKKKTKPVTPTLLKHVRPA